MKLYVIDAKIDNGSVPLQSYVINFTPQKIESSNELDYSSEYNEMRKVVREEYIKYIAELGTKKINDKTVKELFLIEEDCSLWWFNKITKKDSFNDSLFDDICKAMLINKIVQEIKPESVTVFSESLLLNYLWKNKKKVLWICIADNFWKRVKTAVNYVLIKIINPDKPETNIYNIKQLFFTYYPGNWSKDAKGNFSDRFYRDILSLISGSGFIAYQDYPNVSLKDIKQKYFVIQKYLKISEIILVFFNIKNFFRYFIVRNKVLKYFVFKDIDLRMVYDIYFWESVIWKEYYYGMIIKGVRRICEIVKPKCLVSVGEFGLPSRAVLTGAKKENITTVWLQHASLLFWKLWFFNDSSEIVTASNETNKNHIQYMPVADWFIVWGEHSKELLKGYGYPQEKIMILGYPRYDSFSTMKMIAEDNDLLKTIVLTPTVDIEEVTMFSELAKKIKLEIKDKIVVLKLHPRYKELLVKSFLEIISLLEKEGIIIDTGNLEKYYHKSTIIISGFSSVGLEAAYFGIKVITYLSKYHNRFTPDWLEEGTYAYSVEEVVEMIKNHQNIPVLNWQKYYLTPGNVQTKVINFLETISA